MKAKINGIELEGTPAEIAEFSRIFWPIKTAIKPSPDIDPGFWKKSDVHAPIDWLYRPQITCQVTQSSKEQVKAWNGPIPCDTAYTP